MCKVTEPLPTKLSIDLTLSNEFRFYNPGLSVIPITEDTDYKAISTKIVLAEGESYLLLPGQACLGITIEANHLVSSRLV